MLTSPGLHERMDCARLTCSLRFLARAKRAANCERPAPAAWAALGLLAAVDISLGADSVWQRGVAGGAGARRGQLRGQGAQQPDRNNIVKKKSRAEQKHDPDRAPRKNLNDGSGITVLPVLLAFAMGSKQSGEPICSKIATAMKKTKRGKGELTWHQKIGRNLRWGRT